MTTEQVAEDLIAKYTCGFTDCIAAPAYLLQIVHIETTDGGEVELGGFKDDPLNQVCQVHHDDKATAMLIANKAWGIVLRSIEQENPGMLVKIGKKFRMKRFRLGWKEIG